MPIVRTESFDEQAKAIGLSDEEVQYILTNISKAPIIGHQYIAVDAANTPMSGFVGRSWKFPRPNLKLGGGQIEVTTVHLYFRSDCPIYMWDVQELREYEAPWNNKAEALILKASALPVIETWCAAHAATATGSGTND